MTTQNHSHYLQHLGIDYWCQKASKKNEPFLYLLPSQADLLFIVHFSDIKIQKLETFLINIASALEVKKDAVAYIVLNASNNNSLTVVDDFLRENTPKTIMIGSKAFLESFSLEVQNQYHIALNENNSIPVLKKQIMNGLLSNDIL